MFQAETRERMVNEARLRARLAEARLEALEARLHPHFLFNTLNTISSLIRSSPQAAIGVVDDLGDLLRAALHAEPGREVSLTEELELLRRYIDIQQARFPDRLRMSVHADPEARSAFVPQMVLQPIVENAVQHGIAPREAPGTVTIEASRQGDQLRLTVRDDGVGFGQAPPRANNGNGRGIGLTNTRARLAELYGDRFVLDIAAAEPTGTIVTIGLPFHTTPARAGAAASE
jgi:two-component system LytT family sensor kinase